MFAEIEALRIMEWDPENATIRGFEKTRVLPRA